MNTSFYNGISGVKAHQFGIDVIADNISNISTTGFIGKTPEFSTQFSTALTDAYFDATLNDKGVGSRAQANALNTYEQGVFKPTDRAFDMAIDGQGWFGIQGVGGEVFYTRVGAFSVDRDGNMVDEGGNYLMGTLGGNITPTTLSADKLAEFGKSYKLDKSTENPSPFAINPLGDIALGAVNVQSVINLPDILYYPPEPTTFVNYQANLNPQITTQTNTTNITAANNISITPNYPSATITGTLAGNTQIANLKEGDSISARLFDAANNFVSLETTLDADLNFTFSDADISTLDPSTLVLGSELTVSQEVANVEHFTTEIISPDGNKNFIDMTFTKRVPQEQIGSTWDADIQILRFVEDYKILNYDPTITYDPNIYNVDTLNRQVTKIYDPTLYKIDKGQKKVYEIIDAQTGSATFAGGGELLASNIPTLSNNGVPLNLNIGTPYKIQDFVVASYEADGSTLIIKGTGAQAGKAIQVNITDIGGKTIQIGTSVKEDGTWSVAYENNPLNMTADLSTNAYTTISNGFDGMVANVGLDKARVATKDGLLEGILKDYGMDARGNIIAEFDNGRSSAIAKVALYQFVNDQGLANITGTMFRQTENSGEPLFFTNADGSYRGSFIRSNNLEGSNVNYSTALTELIIMQKAFDASAKSITTSDQMIQNAINMKK